MKAKNSRDVETLVKAIIKKDSGMIHIKDSALIPYYLKNSKYMIEIEPEDKADTILYAHKETSRENDFAAIKESGLKHAQQAGFNYVFLSYLYGPDGTLVSIVNPFRIITDKEQDFLLRNFYKVAPEEVSKAAKELDLVIYDKIYSCYAQGRIDMFNDLLHENRESWHKYSPFFEFVFSLPYEDQNIESNKKILTIMPRTCDLVGIMSKEYAEGKHFQEYFGNLSHYEEAQVIEALKRLERKPDQDVFLLTRGYVMGEESAITLYRNDANSFMRYFDKLGDESKKTLIEKIYEEPAVNHEVVAWLEKDYTDLLREVGFSGGKQDGRKK
ncbi:hypothetical protein FJZ53_02575 [Candidatus Woesearchaeota archaeon]|nr:hypothetical protein [Candidatus Woesearchaeota archaeon]